MLKPKQPNHIPPGGWRYTERRTGIKFPVNGSQVTLDWLITEVERHRVATGGDLSPGWRDRLLEEICQQNPSIPCGQDMAPINRALSKSDVRRFMSSMAKFVMNGAKLVDQGEADRRAAICAECPMRTRQTFCMGCMGLRAVNEALIGHREVSNASELGSCAVCGCVLKVKVWFPLESTDNEGLEYPPHCWAHQSQITEPSE